MFKRIICLCAVCALVLSLVACNEMPADTQAPVTEAPITEPPVTEPPATEPPVIDQPEPEPTAGLEYKLNAAGDGYIVTGFDKVQEGHLILGGVYNGLSVTEIGAPDAEFLSISIPM